MDKIQNEIYNNVRKFAVDHDIKLTPDCNDLIVYAIDQTLSKVNGLDKKIDDLAHEFYTETLLYYVHDDTHENEKKIIEMMKEIIRTGIEEYKKIF